MGEFCGWMTTMMMVARCGCPECHTTRLLNTGKWFSGGNFYLLFYHSKKK